MSRETTEAGLIMALSDEVGWNLSNAIEVHNRVLQLDPKGSYTNTVRNGLFHALCDLVVEHFGAIIVLLQREQYNGSAFALLRPVIEASLRAFWLIYVADDDTIAKIAKGDKTFPNILAIYMAVEEILKNLTGSNKVLFVNPVLIKSMHDFTHGGVEHLSRRFDDKLQIKPSYSDIDIISLIGQATATTVTIILERIQRVEGTEHILSPNTETLLTSYMQIRNRQR